MDPGEDDYLDALSDLVAVYEDAHDEFPDITPVQLLAHLIEAKGVTQADVSRDTAIPRSAVSELLSGKRQINLHHIEKLAKYFHVPPSVFLTG
ncbi:MAG: type II toxin-antitoxin system HigA family antitoxin [Planctomycetales bacterium]